MTPDQLKELERLNYQWANPKSFDNDTAISHAVMDLLPDMLAHVKQLTAERDAALRALHEEKEYSEALAKDICDMEDALGFKNDCTDKDGAFIPTKGPWIERVRDLIAKEGELGDCKSELDAANAKCAERRDALIKVSQKAPGYDWNADPDSLTLVIGHAFSLDCGKGYHADSEWKPALMVLKDIATDDLDRVSGGVKQSAQQALAHAERITGKEEV